MSAMTVAETIAKAFGAKKVLVFIIIAAALPFVIYALMSSITIEPTAEFVELGWVKYNEPEWVIKQTVALYILTVLVIGVLLAWHHKLAIAMLAFALTLLTGIVETGLMIEYMNMPVILFLASMMLIVEVVKETGFLRQVINKIIEVTNFEPSLLIIATLMLSAVLAALVDAVVSTVIVVSMVISLAEALEIDPKPLIVALIIATNIGSSATVVGNPVGIYLALRAGLSFSDFLVWATPPALLSVVVVVLLLMRRNRDYIAKARIGIAEKLERGVTLVLPREEGANPLTGGVLLAVTLAGIAVHSTIEKALGLPENALLLGIPMGIAGAVLVWKGEEGRKLFVRGVDWSTLLFFALLFAEAATLESTGVSAKLAALLINGFRSLRLGELVPLMTITALTFIVAILSGFLDNVVVVATASTVVGDLVKAGIPGGEVLWWTVLIGGCYGGNMLPLSSTANIVALSAIESVGHSFGTYEWLKEVALITVLTLLLGSLYISGLYYLS